MAAQPEADPTLPLAATPAHPAAEPNPVRLPAGDRPVSQQRSGPDRAEHPRASGRRDRAECRQTPGDRRRGGRQPGWLPALLALTVAFLVFSLPPYLGFDPARSRLPTRPDLPTYYPMLVGHILFGSVALVTGCLQVWPWLRSRFPGVHRWVGRLYLFGGVFPAGVVVLGVAPLSSTGFASAVGNTLLATLWLVTSLAGYRAARQRRYADHRVWMVRSFALTLSIVLNRVWLVVLLLLGMGVRGRYGVDEATIAASAATASVWLSWTANLLFVEWFVLRRRQRRTLR